jgi:hypothetical protein
VTEIKIELLRKGRGYFKDAADSHNGKNEKATFMKSAPQGSSNGLEPLLPV